MTEKHVIVNTRNCYLLLLEIIFYLRGVNRHRSRAEEKDDGRTTEIIGSGGRG
jgi:hypothetical protein